MNDRDIQRIEAHLRRTFANNTIQVKARTKPKDSAEVFVGEEFVALVYDDEDEDGSFMFEMSILADDLS